MGHNYIIHFLEHDLHNIDLFHVSNVLLDAMCVAAYIINTCRHPDENDIADVASAKTLLVKHYILLFESNQTIIVRR